MQAMQHHEQRKQTLQDALLAARNAGTADAYCAEYPHPVLVCGSFHSVHDSAFFTLAGESQGLGLEVVEIRKSPDRNAFTEMLTIGRARNNDVRLRHASVSKFHAYLRADAGGLALVDAGSTYGTRVNGERLQPDWAHRVVLRSGDALQLGHLEVTYYEAAAFYDLLEETLRGPQ